MSLGGHLRLLTDRRRLEVWAAAIAASVGPDDVVADLGAGLGVLSVLAAKQGARVFAVEREAVAENILLLAAENGVADRVRVLAGDSTLLEPPERVTVCFYDDFRVLDLEGSSRRTALDARERWLTSHGRLLPGAVELCAAFVSLAELLPASVQGVSLAPLLAGALPAGAVRLDSRRALLSDEVVVAGGPLEEVGDGLKARFTSTATASGTLTGLLVWVRLAFGSGLILDTGPGPEPTAYPTMYLPLDGGLDVKAGEPIEGQLEVVVARGARGDHRFWRYAAEDPRGRAQGTTFSAALLAGV